MLVALLLVDRDQCFDHAADAMLPVNLSLGLIRLSVRYKSGLGIGQKSFLSK
jgi:hypothetical protein